MSRRKRRQSRSPSRGSRQQRVRRQSNSPHAGKSRDSKLESEPDEGSLYAPTPIRPEKTVHFTPRTHPVASSRPTSASAVGTRQGDGEAGKQYETKAHTRLAIALKKLKSCPPAETEGARQLSHNARSKVSVTNRQRCLILIALFTEQRRHHNRQGGA